MSTIREAYLEASSFLQRHDVTDHTIIAELLLGHTLSLRRTELYLLWSDPFPEEKAAEWAGYLQRKADGEPVQYITGEQEFYGRPFHVERSVLIPRPETELLVEQIMLIGRQLWPDAARPIVAADIGTGSGAIAVTLAAECPAWQVHAVDLSPEALDTARGNAVLNGVTERVAFHQGDLLGPFIAMKSEQKEARQTQATDSDIPALDIVVSNPPYIETDIIATLDIQVRCYEPVMALDGGPDGLVLYRRLAEQLMQLAPKQPRLVGLEVGQGQAPDVAKLLHNTGLWEEIRIVPDLAGIERHVIGIRW
ncbi:MAG: SAM-dependent methyltransferase [Paenibacillus sp.]|nr:SAM-dependent methyltransferase [Paenibacillus sp.]